MEVEKEIISIKATSMISNQECSVEGGDKYVSGIYFPLIKYLLYLIKISFSSY